MPDYENPTPGPENTQGAGDNQPTPEESAPTANEPEEIIDAEVISVQETEPPPVTKPEQEPTSEKEPKPTIEKVHPPNIWQRVKHAASQVVKVPAEKSPEDQKLADITQRFEKGKEVSEEDLKLLFSNLVEGGLNSSIAQLGARVEGFKHVQDAMLKLDQSDYITKATGQRIERESTGKFLNPVIDKIPNRMLRESVRNGVRSGVISAVALTAISLLGGPVTLAAAGISLGGSVAGRAIASYFSREKTIFKADKDQASVADQTAEALLEKLSQAHKKALDAHEALQDRSEAETASEQAKVMADIITALREKDTQTIPNYHELDKKARRWEVVGGIAGSLLAGGAASFLHHKAQIGERVAEAAQAKQEALDHGVRMVGNEHTTNDAEGHLVKWVNGKWQYVLEEKDLEAARHGVSTYFDPQTGQTGQFTQGVFEDAQGLADALPGHSYPLYHEMGKAFNGLHLDSPDILQMYQDAALNTAKESSILAGAIGASHVLDSLRWGRSASQGKKAHVQLGRVYSAAQEAMANGAGGIEAESAGGGTPDQERTNGRGEVSPERRQRIEGALDNLISREKNGDAYIDKIMRGEPVPDAARFLPKNVDDLMGGFAGRDELLEQAPNAIRYALKYARAQVSTELDSKRTLAWNRLITYLEEVDHHLTAGPFGETYSSLTDLLVFTRLSTQFKGVGEHLFNREVSETTANSTDFFGALIAKAGYKDSGTAAERVKVLQDVKRYLELYPDLSTEKRTLRTRMVSGVANLINSLQAELVAEKDAAAAAAKNQQRGKKGRRGGQ